MHASRAWSLRALSLVAQSLSPLQPWKEKSDLGDLTSWPWAAATLTDETKQQPITLILAAQAGGVSKLASPGDEREKHVFGKC